MLFDEKFRRPDGIQRLVKELWDISQETGPIRLMEICGTHTMAIAKAGLRSLLPPSIQLLSGPGCPVCVTPAGAIAGCDPCELWGPFAGTGFGARGYAATPPRLGRAGPDGLFPHGGPGNRCAAPGSGSHLPRRRV